jgi:hypothetical protein
MEQPQAFRPPVLAPRRFCPPAPTLMTAGMQNRRKYLRLQWSKAGTILVDANQLLRTDEAAAYLAVSPETLCAWRRRRIGPPYFRFRGASVRDQSYVHHDWPLSSATRCRRAGCRVLSRDGYRVERTARGSISAGHRRREIR